MFDELKRKRRYVRYPVINWGRGRLLPYESMGAFISKFRRLNGLSFKKARDFIDRLFQGTGWQSTQLADHSIRVLSTLLDERRSIVSKLDFRRLSLDGCYGTFYFPEARPHTQRVMYCPECIKSGYHALFHQLYWLKKCPIHLVKLLSEAIEFPGVGSHFDRYCKKVEQILERENPNWLSINGYEPIEDWLYGKNFREFACWIRAQQRLARTMHSKVILSLKGTAYFDAESLLSRTGNHVRLPKRLEEVLGFKPSILRPIIKHYPIEPARLLAKALSNCKFNDLILFYRTTIAIKGQQLKCSSMVKELIFQLQIKDTQFKSHWRWSDNFGWGKVTSDSWIYWDLLSPCQLAIRGVSQNWEALDFEAGTFNERYASWQYYIIIASILYKHGLVTPIDESCISPSGEFFLNPLFKPIIDQFLDADVIEIIEDILFEEAVAYCVNIRTWMTTLTEDDKPPDLPKPVSKGNLMIDGNEAYLLMWP